MGEAAEDVVREIAEARESIGAKVDELVGQVKETAGTAKKTGIKVAAVALAVVATYLVIRKIRSRG